MLLVRSGNNLPHRWLPRRHRPCAPGPVWRFAYSSVSVPLVYPRTREPHVITLVIYAGAVCASVCFQSTLYRRRQSACLQGPFWHPIERTADYAREQRRWATLPFQANGESSSSAGRF